MPTTAVLGEDVAEPTGGLAGWAIGLMESLGGPGAALVVGLDNVFPPIPSELVLPLAGFAAAQGVFPLWAAVFWTTLGSVLGALLTYGLGAALGPVRARRLLARIPLLRHEDLDRTEAWFDRHGARAVFLGRMVPVFRSLISLPAGARRMPLPRFLALTAAGSLLWNTGFVLAGYLLGQNWALVERYAGWLQYVVLGLGAAAGLWFVLRRLRERRTVRG